MYIHTYVYIHTYTCPSQSEKSHGCVSSTVRVNSDMPPPWSRWSWAKYVYFAREAQDDSDGRSHIFIWRRDRKLCSWYNVFPQLQSSTYMLIFLVLIQAVTFGLL